MPMNGIVLSGVYERISIQKYNTQKSPGIQSPGFFVFNQLENAIDNVCWNTWMRKEHLL